MRIHSRRSERQTLHTGGHEISEVVSFKLYRLIATSWNQLRGIDEHILWHIRKSMSRMFRPRGPSSAVLFIDLYAMEIAHQSLEVILFIHICMYITRSYTFLNAHYTIYLKYLTHPSIHLSIHPFIHPSIYVSFASTISFFTSIFSLFLLAM